MSQNRQRLWLLVAAALILAACEPKFAAKPPAEKSDDPTLATVGRYAITTSFLKTSLSNVPVIFRANFMSDEGKRDFLERQIDAMTYAQEGERRQWDKTPEFRNKMRMLETTALVYLAKKKAAESMPPITDDQLRERYEQYTKQAADRSAAVKPFEEARESLLRSAERGRINHAAEERVKALKTEYGMGEKRELLAREPKDMPLGEDLVTSRAFNLNVRDFFLWAKNQTPDYQQQLKTEAGRNWLLDRHIEDELLHLDALAQQLHQTDEFKTRMEVARINVLGKLSENRITATNIDATGVETREFYDAHKSEFGDKPFEEVETAVRAKATAAKRARIVKEFADALRRDRYLVNYYEANVAALDLSTVTEGDIGLMVMPTADHNAPDVDVEALLGSGVPASE